MSAQSYMHRHKGTPLCVQVKNRSDEIAKKLMTEVENFVQFTQVIDITDKGFVPNTEVLSDKIDTTDNQILNSFQKEYVQGPTEVRKEGIASREGTDAPHVSDNRDSFPDVVENVPVASVMQSTSAVDATNQG